MDLYNIMFVCSRFVLLRVSLVPRPSREGERKGLGTRLVSGWAFIVLQPYLVYTPAFLSLIYCVWYALKNHFEVHVPPQVGPDRTCSSVAFVCGHSSYVSSTLSPPAV